MDTLRSHYAKHCPQSHPHDLYSNLEEFSTKLDEFSRTQQPLVYRKYSDLSRYSDLSPSATTHQRRPIRPQDIYLTPRRILERAYHRPEDAPYFDDPAVNAMWELVFKGKYDLPKPYTNGGDYNGTGKFKGFTETDIRHFWERYNYSQSFGFQQSWFADSYGEWLSRGNCPPPRSPGAGQAGQAVTGSEGSGTVETKTSNALDKPKNSVKGFLTENWKGFALAGGLLAVTWALWGVSALLVADDVTGVGTVDDPVLAVTLPAASAVTTATVATITALAASALLYFGMGATDPSRLGTY